jgi:hypothetical protein
MFSVHPLYNIRENSLALRWNAPPAINYSKPARPRIWLTYVAAERACSGEGGGLSEDGFDCRADGGQSKYIQSTT